MPTSMSIKKSYLSRSRLQLARLGLMLCAFPLGAAGAPKAILLREFIAPVPTTPQSHAATLVQTGDALVAAWFGGKHERDPGVGIWLSRDSGGRWTMPVEVADGVQPDGTRQPCWNPVLFQPARWAADAVLQGRPRSAALVGHGEDLDATAASIGARRSGSPTGSWGRSRTSRCNWPTVPSSARPDARTAAGASISSVPPNGGLELDAGRRRAQSREDRGDPAQPAAVARRQTAGDRTHPAEPGVQHLVPRWRQELVAVAAARAGEPELGYRCGKAAPTAAPCWSTTPRITARIGGTAAANWRWRYRRMASVGRGAHAGGRARRRVLLPRGDPGARWPGAHRLHWKRQRIRHVVIDPGALSSDVTAAPSDCRAALPSIVGDGARRAAPHGLCRKLSLAEAASSMRPRRCEGRMQISMAFPA